MRRAIKDTTVWHTWFAWHPIAIDEQYVWLETVQRKQTHVGWDFWYTEYKNVD